MNLPWHRDITEGIATLEAQKQLPHAIMLSGGVGLGAGRLAEDLAALILCEHSVESRACGKCKSCSLFEAGSHNDFVRLCPEEEGKQIKVDAVRELVEFVTESSMRGGHKVAIINPVEAMNLSGSNALLKTLEEPAGDTILFLVAERQEAVLPTIRSRCQIKTIFPPRPDEAQLWLRSQNLEQSDEQISAYLAIAHNEPLKALRYAEQGAWDQQLAMLKGLSEALKREVSVPDLAANWSDEFLDDRLEWLIQWAEQMIRYESTKDEAMFSHPQGVAMLRYLSGKSHPELLFALRDKMLKEFRLLRGTTNPNPQLLCESVILAWLELM
jgi:DNA polymerase-3 subunit delta'